jgi:hypothetical protein
MLHFRELYELDEILVVRERAEFFPALERLFAQIGNGEHSAKLKRSAQFFHAQDAQPYAEKVADLVDRMIASEPAPRYDAQTRPGKRYAAETWMQNHKVFRTARRAIKRLRALKPTPKTAAAP